MTNHNSDTQYPIFGFIFAIICKIDTLFIGDLGKSFAFGIAGAMGGWVFKIIVNKYKK